MAASPPGTAFTIKAGLHRLQSVVPKSGNTFTGEPGTILSGAKILTDWTSSGATWWGGTQETGYYGRYNPGDPRDTTFYCDRGFQRCDLGEDLWMDGVRKHHESTLAAMDRQPEPLVVKASGLAGGKGAIVCATRVEAKAAVHSMLEAGDFGEAGRTVVIEAFLEGEEISVMAVTDGRDLELDAARLVIQPGMTGSLMAYRRALRPEEAKYAVLRAELDSGRELVYHDVRRLGTLLLLNEKDWARYNAAIGPEPLDDDFSAERLGAALRRSRQAIKKVIMDQRHLAGVGNIYANEALFAAGIDPSKTGPSPYGRP